MPNTLHTSWEYIKNQLGDSLYEEYTNKHVRESTVLSTIHSNTISNIVNALPDYHPMKVAQFHPNKWSPYYIPKLSQLYPEIRS